MPSKPAAKSKRTPKKKTAAPPADGPDPRFEPVVRAFARTAGFSIMESKSGGSRGLMLNGKSFGMSQHGRFMLKLTEERAAALIAEGIGKPFSPSAGRVLRSWIEVTHPKADWVALAKEAHRIGAAEQAAGAKKTKTKT
jgi:hypothetical protein